MTFNDDDAPTSAQLSVEQRASMLVALGILANAFGAGHLDLIAQGGDLDEADLRRGVAGIDGPLRRPPTSAWLQFEALFDPHPVPGTDPTEFEAVVPLWTDRGVVGRGVRVRLAPLGFRRTYLGRVLGFEDGTAWPSGWDTLPPDPLLPKEPTGGTVSSAPVPPENPIPERWRARLRDVIHRLVERDYEGLQEDGVIVHLGSSGDMVKDPIEDYHDPLVDLPEHGWSWAEHGPAYDGPGVYWVSIPMWTEHQGLSDLTLQGEVWDNGGPTSAWW